MEEGASITSLSPHSASNLLSHSSAHPLTPQRTLSLLNTPSHKVAEIWAKMKEAEVHWFDPDRKAGANPGKACSLAKVTGFYQPYEE
jgi:hypothetical protein